MGTWMLGFGIVAWGIAFFYFLFLPHMDGRMDGWDVDLWGREWIPKWDRIVQSVDGCDLDSFNTI